MKLLIVDDEFLTRQGLANGIPVVELGISAIELADDGDSGYQLAIEFCPDIILADVRMPTLNGIDMAIKIQQVLPNCKFIFMSGFSDIEYLKSAIDLHALKYVEKPIAMEEVVSALHQGMQMIKKEIQTSNLLQTGASHVRQDLAERLIEKNWNDAKSILYINSPTIHVPPTALFVTVLLIVFELLKPFDSLRTTLFSLFDNVAISNIWTFKDGEFIVHFYFQNSETEKGIQKSLDAIYGRISTELIDSCNFYIAQGSVSKGIDDVYRSYEMADSTMKRAFFHRPNSVLIYNSPVSDSYQLQEDVADRFSEALHQENQEEIKQIIHQLTKDLSSHPNTSVNYARNIFVKLLRHVFQYADDQGINILSHDNDEPFNQLLTYLNVFDTANFLIKTVLRLYDSVHLLPTHFLVTKITHYIHTHYANRELCLQDIGDHVGFTVSHMCYVFKEQTGTTIKQRLHEYRVEKAKVLLKDSRLKISDIATQVGYSNGEYFSKRFRQVTHRMPSEYRAKTHD